MNRIERRVRNMINPCSTAFARWWCHSGRYMRLVRMITGNKAAAQSGTRGPSTYGANGDASEAFGLHPPTPSMAARRAAIDALLARMTEGEEDAGQG
jgi:hypothetical protein